MRRIRRADIFERMMRDGTSTHDVGRRDFLKRTATGKMQIADPGAVWIDITDE